MGSNASFVLDASIALSWCFEDESSRETRQILEQLAEDSAWVPGLWHLEVANVLSLAEAHAKITAADSAKFIALLEDLSIQVDELTHERAFHEILGLAKREKLTAYDAAYLELAMRLGLPLASKDKILRKAAQNLGVKLI